jgi:fatty acid desaturase
MSAKTIREKYTRSFVGMSKYPRQTAWLIVFGYVFQIVVSLAAGVVLVSLPLTWLTAVIGVVLMLLVATRMRGLNNIVHECSHATFSEHRQDNARIGKICAALLFNSFSEYRDEHLSHHAHLGDYEHDLDLKGIQNLRLHDPLTTRVILRHIMTPFLGRHLPYYLGLNMSARDGQVYQALKVGVLVAVAAVTYAVPMAGILFLIVPFVLIYSSLNYWADCMDHAGLVEAGDDLKSSRNVLAPSVIRWLFFPRNDCFHLVHHLFPHVPARHLETTHLELMKDRLYRARDNAVRDPSNIDGKPDRGGMTAAE